MTIVTALTFASWWILGSILSPPRTLLLLVHFRCSPYQKQPIRMRPHPLWTGPQIALDAGNLPREKFELLLEVAGKLVRGWEVRGIAFYKHWHILNAIRIQDEKSALAAAIPPAINVIHESSPAPSSVAGSPAKHPSIKRAQGQSKARKGSKRSKELALAGDSVISSDVPQTREPSVDTEMLSLAGDGDADDGGLSSLPRTSGAKGQYKRRMGDAEMEEFLADD